MHPRDSFPPKNAVIDVNWFSGGVLFGKKTHGDFV